MAKSLVLSFHLLISKTHKQARTHAHITILSCKMHMNDVMNIMRNWVLAQGTVSLSEPRCQNVPSNLCAQRTVRSTRTFAESDQNLHWAHFGKPKLLSLFMRTRKTQFRLCVR